MVKKKEIGFIVFAIILMALVISFNYKSIETNIFLNALLISAIIIIFGVLVRYLVAGLLDIEIEHSVWKLERYGLYRRRYFIKPIPMGILMPLLLGFLSLGEIKWLALLQVDIIKALPSKIAKRFGVRRFAEIKEFDVALIIFWGLIATLVITGIALLGNYDMLAKYSLYYAIWNLIPISQLDGLKLLLSSRALYILACIFTLIALVLVLIF